MPFSSFPNGVFGPAQDDNPNWKCPKCDTINAGAECTKCYYRPPSEAMDNSSELEEEEEDGDENKWTCDCGTANSGSNCDKCGQRRVSPYPMPIGVFFDLPEGPNDENEWVCGCGYRNSGGMICGGCNKRPRRGVDSEAPDSYVTIACRALLLGLWFNGAGY